jgi:hypothetical protein
VGGKGVSGLKAIFATSLQQRFSKAGYGTHTLPLLRHSTGRQGYGYVAAMAPLHYIQCACRDCGQPEFMDTGQIIEEVNLEEHLKIGRVFARNCFGIGFRITQEDAVTGEARI